MDTDSPRVWSSDDEGPTHLYKYSCIKDGGREHEASDIFLKKQLWLSSVQAYNDPFDGRFALSLEGDHLRASDWIIRVLTRQEPTLDVDAQINKALSTMRRLAIIRDDPEQLRHLEDAIYNDLVSRVGLICFSAVSDNILMWSHYANCHRGFCLGFKVHIPDETFIPAQPIEYCDQYPIMNPLTQEDEEQLKAFFFRKAKLWSYEEEWRFVSLKLARQPFSFPPQTLTGVIFGSSMCPAHKDKIRAWLEGYPGSVECLQAHLDRTTYSICISPAD